MSISLFLMHTSLETKKMNFKISSDRRRIERKTYLDFGKIGVEP